MHSEVEKKTKSFYVKNSMRFKMVPEKFVTIY